MNKRLKPLEVYRVKEARRRCRRWRRLFSSFLLPPSSLFVLVLLAHPAPAYDEVIDSPMYKKPDVPAAPLAFIHPAKAKELWLQALAQPEADLKCKAADAIALGHRRGMKGLEITIDPLLAAFDQPDQHATVRVALARTLIALDAKKAAASLFQQAQAAGGDLREIVEPALARWDFRPAREVWLKRLSEPKTPQRALILAIQSLAVVKDEKATDFLREIVLKEEGGRRKDEKNGPSSDSSFLLPPSSFVKLEAARALGSLRRDGLEKDAERIAQDGSPRGLLDRLCAASLLRYHHSKEAIQLLQRLLDDKEPAVIALAAAGLIDVDPELVVPGLERLLANADANVRAAAVEVLFRLPTEKHMHLLADRLDDVHMEVRVKARQKLLALAAKKELLDPVVAEGKRILATEQWRGLEQAVILLTQLDRKESAVRLVALLPFGRSEVRVTAAWGLRKLDVPETLPGVASHVETALKHAPPGNTRTPDPQDISSATYDHQLSQLNQFLGQRKYEKADGVLRGFVPRRGDNGWPEARAAAIWALGMIHDGKPDGALATQLEERLNDTSSRPPEDPRVRCMSAIVLGRLQAKEALPSLEKTCPQFAFTEDPVNNACGWAIEQLTGKKMPPAKPVFKGQGGWFLLPFEP
jgi:HEAT repeat protein